MFRLDLGSKTYEDVLVDVEELEPMGVATNIPLSAEELPDAVVIGLLVDEDRSELTYVVIDILLSVEGLLVAVLIAAAFVIVKVSVMLPEGLDAVLAAATFAVVIIVTRGSVVVSSTVLGAGQDGPWVAGITSGEDSVSGDPGTDIIVEVVSNVSTIELIRRALPASAVGIGMAGGAEGKTGDVVTESAAADVTEWSPSASRRVSS